jgi:hypothetical protein
MFKQNDYIVTLKVDTNFPTDCARDNWCFKQKYNKDYIQPCINLLGNTDSFNGNLLFNKSKKLKDWRFATPEEIAEYDRLGKPFDVTTLKPKELSKEELLEEAKRKYPIGSQVKSVFDDLFDTVKEQSHFNYPDAWNGDTPQIWFTGDRYGLLIYDRGKWAEIVSKPESVEKMEEPKELTSLPEKWVVRNPRNEESEKLYAYANVHGAIPPYTDGTWFHFPPYEGATTKGKIAPGYTEITFDQFKRWVLKESSSSEIPEYVECIESSLDWFKVGRIYTFPNPVKENGVKSTVGILNGNVWKFKSSTKEAYEAQQKPQTMVQKWAVGTYVVFLKKIDSLRVKGFTEEIIRGPDPDCVLLKFSDSCSIAREDDEEIKWFATQKEAEEFAKTLREPEPVKSSVEPEWTPQVGDWIKCIGDSKCTSNHTSGGWEKDLVFKITKIHTTFNKLIAFGGKNGDGVWVFESNLRKALPHEIPTERGSGIIEQIESVKDYGVLTEEKLKGFVSDLFYTPSEPSPKVDTALPMISFVIPPREI